LALVNVIEF